MSGSRVGADTLLLSRVQGVSVAHLLAVERTTLLLQNSDHAFPLCSAQYCVLDKLLITE